MFIVSGIFFVLAIICGLVGFGQTNIYTNEYALYLFFLTTFLSISCFFIHLSDGDIRINQGFEKQRENRNEYKQQEENKKVNGR